MVFIKHGGRTGMTKEDIIRMAREADLWGEIYAMQRFANLVAEAVMPKEALAEMFEWGKDAGRREEREACAKVCDGWPDYNVQGLAEAIRARGQK
jgi:hypothetical protein